MRTLAAVAEVADLPVTLLAVPRFHGEAATPELVDWLEARRRRGDELALHGWSHRDEATAPATLSTACGGVYTRGEGEFWALSERGDPPHRGRHRLVPRARLAARRLRGAGLAARSPATMARDLNILCADGVFELARVQPLDMFPQTQHVECVAPRQLARLERCRRPRRAFQPAAAPRAASARRRFRCSEALVAEDPRAGAAGEEAGDRRRVHARLPSGRRWCGLVDDDARCLGPVDRP
jgi:hypothetical protein